MNGIKKDACCIDSSNPNEYVGPFANVEKPFQKANGNGGCGWHPKLVFGLGLVASTME